MNDSQHAPVRQSAPTGEVELLRREVAALRREVARHRPPHRTRRTRARIVAALSVALLVALVPTSILAVNPFTDLDPAQATGHNPNIDAIYNAGITTGCAPTEYCPKEFVTREQMASFLARTAGLGDNKPVANAARLATTNPTATSRNYAANELVRLARGKQSAPLNLTPTYQDVMQIQMTAPVTGYVLIVSGVEVFVNAGAASVAARINCTFSPTDPTPEISPEQRLDIPLDPDYAFFSPSHGCLLSAGLQYELRLQMKEVSGQAVAQMGTMTAIFVPFNGAGVAP
jgi:hypothetical protein